MFFSATSCFLSHLYSSLLRANPPAAPLTPKYRPISSCNGCRFLHMFQSTCGVNRISVDELSRIRSSHMLKRTRLETSAQDEPTLVHCAKRGKVEAFEELVRRNAAMILRVAVRITGSHEDGEDVVQDACLQAFRRLDTFEERARFSTWLTRIVINAALMKLRTLRRSSTVSIDENTEGFQRMGETIADSKPNPERNFAASEFRLALQRALIALPHGQRVVFLMREVEGLSTVDTADALELSVPSVKSRLLRARFALRKSLCSYSRDLSSATFFHRGSSGLSRLAT
jgi:RNA polymerase sigma-70 factor, ECF subfamily